MKEDQDKFFQDHPTAEVFPGKGVFVRKVKGTKVICKARGVVCGNFVHEVGGTDYAACQTDATALRVALRMAALMKWSFWSVDVKTAFLNADLDDDDIVLVKPPRIFNTSGAVPEEALWWVRKALYGLRQAPMCWQRHRDEALKRMAIKGEDGKELKCCRMRSGPGLWTIQEVKNPEKEARGFLVTYVDDILVMTRSMEGAKWITEIKKEWETSEPEWAQSRQEVSTKKEEDRMRWMTKGKRMDEITCCGLQLR